MKYIKRGNASTVLDVVLRNLGVADTDEINGWFKKSYAGKYRIDGLDAMCLIAPANPQLPDPRAAASILIPLSKIVPRFDVDPQPLIQEAQEIEDRLRSQQASQQPINHNIYG